MRTRNPLLLKLFIFAVSHFFGILYMYYNRNRVENEIIRIDTLSFTRQYEVVI